MKCIYRKKKKKEKKRKLHQHNMQLVRCEAKHTNGHKREEDGVQVEFIG